MYYLFAARGGGFDFDSCGGGFDFDDRGDGCGLILVVVVSVRCSW